MKFHIYNLTGFYDRAHTKFDNSQKQRNLKKIINIS